MRAGNTFVYKATATAAEPLCVCIGDNSITIFTRDDGEVIGFLLYDHKDNDAKLIHAAGNIPAKYVLFEEQCRI